MATTITTPRAAPPEDREVAAAALATEIQAYFQEHADPAFVEKAELAWTLGEGYDPYGLPPGLLGSKRDEWLALHGDELGLDGFLDVGDLLLDSGKWESGLLAIDFVEHFAVDFNRETFRRVGRWLDGAVRNYIHCDTIATRIVGPMLRMGIVSPDDLGEWRTAHDRFKRRAVPVAVRALMFGRKTRDYTPWLDFLRPMMLEHDPVVQKVLGGLLCDAWRKQPAQVEAFLHEWKDLSPGLIIRQATRRMSPETKAHFARIRASSVQRP
ncbi:MAG TPA: DNA alkylation repair protein [Chloroflexia bacterium]|nr:DNA alkylation repair protein [Chloroflexia bacterium]